MRQSVAVVFISVALMGAVSMPTPKEQCETLLDSVLPFAERMLRQHSEFYPFGASMKPDGTVALAASYNGTEHQLSDALIKLLREGFQQSARGGEIIATALVYDVQVVEPGATRKTDAVAVELDHRDNYSVVVYFPYVLKSDQTTLGTAFANAGQSLIFARSGG